MTISIPSISVHQAQDWLKDGRAVLVDVRDRDEHLREHIVNSQNIPLTKIGEVAAFPADKSVVFYCRSGNRTRVQAEVLSSIAPQGYILEGGLDEWKRAGFRVFRNTKQPIEIMRQVQITAGFLAFLGAALALTVSPHFLYLSAFVGAGLMMAGLTGVCTMARILRLLPWNAQVTARTERAQ